MYRAEKNRVILSRDRNRAGWWGRQQERAGVQLASCYSNSFMPFPKKRVYEGPKSRLNTKAQFGNTSYLEMFRPPASVEVPVPLEGNPTLRNNHKQPARDEPPYMSNTVHENMRNNYKGFTGKLQYGFASTSMGHERN